MSKKLLNSRLYKQSDWKSASRLERIYIHLMQPEDFALSEKDEDYHEDLKVIFVIIQDELNSSAAIPKIRDVLPNIGSDARLYRMISDCKELYGNIVDSNKKFDRYVVGQKFIEIYKKALEAKEIDVARLALYNYTKLMGLDQPDEGFDPESINLPTIVFSDDPKLLNAEDVEYEDLE